jgi:hypothetical protein
MEEWARDQECANVLLFPTATASSPRHGHAGRQVRPRLRQALVALFDAGQDGVVEKMFIEPQKPGDPFEVSDADTMLAYLNPKAKKPDQVAIFTREGLQLLRQGERRCSRTSDTTTPKCRSTTASRTKVIGASPARARCRRSSSTAATSAAGKSCWRWAKKAA